MAPLMEEKRIQDQLSYLILLAEQVRAAVVDSVVFKAECEEVGTQVDRLMQLLQAVVRYVTSAQSLYERPIRRVVSEVLKNLECALTLVSKCKRGSVLSRVVRIVPAASFQELSNLFDASVGNMRWLLRVFDSGISGTSAGVVLTMPPIARYDPILAWVWSGIATLHTGELSDRIEATILLVGLAKDNDRNRSIIIKEGGVPPLLKLQKEMKSSDAIATLLDNINVSATLLDNIANDLDVLRVY